MRNLIRKYVVSMELEREDLPRVPINRCQAQRVVDDAPFDDFDDFVPKGILVAED